MSLFDETGLQRQELTTGSKLRRAIKVARNMTPRQRRYFLHLLKLDSRVLSSVTSKGRIRWGRIVCEELSDHFQLGPDKPEPDQRIFLVTLCDRRCCTPHDARDIDVRRFIRILRRGLRGLSYLGMLEPAYYVNVCEGLRIYGKRLVSWHLHLLVWGASREEMKDRIERLNRDVLLPIAKGLDGAHQKCISKGKLASKIAYMLKAPQKGYRLFKIEVVTADGEIIPKFIQRKQDLRPGEHVTLFRLMKDKYLDRLALAGGEGASILRQLKRQVLEDLRL
jgi:hypothetical protein